MKLAEAAEARELAKAWEAKRIAAGDREGRGGHEDRGSRVGRPAALPASKPRVVGCDGPPRSARADFTQDGKSLGVLRGRDAGAEENGGKAQKKARRPAAEIS
jgi:hypothetical protein